MWKYGQRDDWNVVKFTVLKSVKYIRTHNDIIFWLLKKDFYTLPDQGAKDIEHFGTDNWEQKRIIHI